MRKVLVTCEKAQKCPTLFRVVVANGTPQHRILFFHRIKNSADGDRRFDFQLHLRTNLSERAEMLWQEDPNCVGVHSVCTSTDSTAGKSCTMACQLSPASFDTYTCPPVVPK